MPQFDPSSYSMQLFWLAVIFIALYVTMAMVALPRIGSVLEERQRRIDDNLAKAAQLKADADAAVALYEQALAQSRAQATQLLKDNADKLAREAEARQKALSDKLEERIKEGEARISQEKTQALSQIKSVAIEAAQLAASKLTGISMDEAKVAGAVEAVIGERS